MIYNGKFMYRDLFLKNNASEDMIISLISLLSSAVLSGRLNFNNLKKEKLFF